MLLKHCILAWLLLMTTSVSALAQDVKRECVDASTVGQTNRDAGQLLAAREQFLICSRDACPAVVRSSCGRWLSEVQELTPSVVVRAADSADADITEGSASIDGTEFPLDGRAIPLDPGKHVVIVETKDGARAEKKLLLAAGEKSRLIELRVEAQSSSRASQPSGAALQPARAGSADRGFSVPTGTWILGGVSVVALGSFGFFAVSAKSELDKLRRACSPSCTDQQTRPGRTDALVADISLGVSVAALTGAITWALVSGPRSRPSPNTARVSVSPLAHGGYAAFLAPF